MAETLGSLVDKLSIKDIRLWHLSEEIRKTSADNPQLAELKIKINIVKEQRNDLKREIDDFLERAIRGQAKLREQKVKLYNKSITEKIIAEETLGELTDKLASKNIELWHLEDEVRRTDVSDSYLVETKRKIDRANQERNDLMDKIDEALEKTIKNKFKKK